MSMNIIEGMRDVVFVHCPSWTDLVKWIPLYSDFDLFCICKGSLQYFFFFFFFFSEQFDKVFFFFFFIMDVNISLSILYSPLMVCIICHRYYVYEISKQ